MDNGQWTVDSLLPPGTLRRGDWFNTKGTKVHECCRYLFTSVIAIRVPFARRGIAEHSRREISSFNIPLPPQSTPPQIVILEPERFSRRRRISP
jgi:hypothetical protein